MRRDVLHYLKRPDSARAQGAIGLPAVSHLQTDTARYPQPFCFQLVTPGRVYSLQAPSKAAMVHWMAALTSAMEALRATQREAQRAAAAAEQAVVARQAARQNTQAAEAALANARAALETEVMDADALYPRPGSSAAVEAEAAARAAADSPTQDFKLFT